MMEILRCNHNKGEDSHLHTIPIMKMLIMIKRNLNKRAR